MMKNDFRDVNLFAALFLRRLRLHVILRMLLLHVAGRRQLVFVLRLPLRMTFLNIGYCVRRRDCQCESDDD